MKHVEQMLSSCCILHVNIPESTIKERERERERERLHAGPKVTLKTMWKQPYEEFPKSGWTDFTLSWSLSESTRVWQRRSLTPSVTGVTDKRHVMLPFVFSSTIDILLVLNSDNWIADGITVSSVFSPVFSIVKTISDRMSFPETEWLNELIVRAAHT